MISIGHAGGRVGRAGRVPAKQRAPAVRDGVFRMRRTSRQPALAVTQQNCFVVNTGLALQCRLAFVVAMPTPRSPAKRRPAPVAPGDANLEARVRHVVSTAPVDRSLPTTREIGKRLGVANTSVYRILQRFAERGEIWQHPTSGRYFPTAARALFDRPKPVACLLRRLELASEQYRELLEGISLGCGDRQRTMLLWHDDSLVNHPETHEVPVFAGVARQRAILGEFLDRHGGAAGGFVLDHVWSDAALRAYGERLEPAVVLYRTCAVEGFANIRADFHAGALKALAHVLGRGYERIIPVAPFAGDPAVAEFFAELTAAADETTCRERLQPVAPASTDAERATLIERLRREKVRTVLICPEDNVSLFLAKAMCEAGLECPGRAGLLSAMGTDFATKAGLTCLRYDFRAMGRLAIETLAGNDAVSRAVDPQLFVGETT